MVLVERKRWAYKYPTQPILTNKNEVQCFYLSTFFENSITNYLFIIESYVPSIKIPILSVGDTFIMALIDGYLLDMMYKVYK